MEKSELDIVEASIVEGRIIKTNFDQENLITKTEIYKIQQSIKIESDVLEAMRARTIDQNAYYSSLKKNIVGLINKVDTLTRENETLTDRRNTLTSEINSHIIENNSLISKIQINIQILNDSEIDIKKKNNIFVKREKELELKNIELQEKEKILQERESFINDTMESLKQL